jgi:hypothetical protein
MTIARGARLGPYEIVAQIGAGGMGEVNLVAQASAAADLCGFRPFPETERHLWSQNLHRQECLC